MSDAKPLPIAMPVRPFSPGQQATLNALMTLMIPASRDGVMPAAASLGLYDDLRTLPTTVRSQFERGLDALTSRAEDKTNQAFAALPDQDARALVEALRTEDPVFINAFTLHTSARYLQHDSVMTALRLEPRPHWPLGHAVPESDWSLLDPVRQRGAVWRQV